MSAPRCIHSQSPLIYWASRRFGRFVWFCCADAQILHPERLDYPGGYLLACNHFHHLDPFILSTLYRRPIDWLTRIEFYKYQWSTWLLDRLGSIPVNRRGVPVRAIRMAIARVNQGRIVGIFPEGGVVAPEKSVCIGEPIKQGVCLISCRTGLPIIPVVMLGTEHLSRVRPWLPFHHGQLWIAIGEPIFPPKDIASRKIARRSIATELHRQLGALYLELRSRFADNDL